MRVNRIGAVAAISSLALGGVACTGHAAHNARATTTATTTVTATVTAAPSATITQQQRTVVTVAPPTQAPADAVGDIVTGSGSALTAPTARTTKAFTGEAYEGCYGLLDTGFFAEGCTLAQSAAGAAVGLVETSGTQERDVVYTVHGPTATLALRSTRTVPAPQGGLYNADATRVETADLALDNSPKLVFSVPVFSRSYVTAYTSVDVVEATGQVVVHRDLDGGMAGRAFGGGLETWVPNGAKVERDIIQWRSGAWRITAADVVSKGDVPGNAAL